ncbi:hypothetical protein [Thalassobaculum sp.]|uniref:hypothetical protein n=1 Tax=Thalassobaculum sp. TaxID=2022740 RepID=UPI003B5B64FC
MKHVDQAREAAAMSYALATIDRMTVEEVELFGISAVWLNKAHNRQFAVEMVKRIAVSRPEALMDVVDLARDGVSVADEALRELMLEYSNRGEVMPTYLSAYNMELLAGRPPGRPGRKKADFFLRDIAIFLAVLLVSERFGLTPTGRNLSACSIVANAFNGSDAVGDYGSISYKDIEGIWSRYKKIAAPDWIPKQPGAPFVKPRTFEG